MCRSEHAGRDIVRNENKTHIELNTRHVVAKTGGFRLFDIHEEGSGGSPGLTGMTGIGMVGKVMILAVLFLLAMWAFRKVMACRAKSEAYKQFYRQQVAASQVALPYPTTARDYGPNQRATMELLREVKAARQELRAAKRSAEGLTTTGTTATIHTSPMVKSHTVYDDSDERDQ